MRFPGNWIKPRYDRYTIYTDIKIKEDRAGLEVQEVIHISVVKEVYGIY